MLSWGILKEEINLFSSKTAYLNQLMLDKPSFNKNSLILSSPCNCLHCIMLSLSLFVYTTISMLQSSA